MDHNSVPTPFKELYNSAKYTDVTLVFGGHTMPAHKLILVANGGDYFKALFDSGFSESTKDRIELVDDPNPHAIYGLISTFYGHGGYDKNRVTADKNGAEYLKYVVDVYVVASKYLVPSICSRILRDLPEMLADCIGYDGYPARLETIAKHIYIDNTEAAIELRKPLVNMIAAHVTEWADYDAFGQMLLDIPGLAFDIIITQARNGGSPAKKPKGPAASTRKRTRAQAKDEDLSIDGLNL